MIVTIRIGFHGGLFIVGASFLSIHAIANGGCEANSCHVGIDVLLSGGVEGYRRR